ncbi:MAG TPA: tRNA (N6-isopentenyl adenosine(37)-C2)-methylthiotransferase MiaB [Rhizobiales bacterium]|nr:tRNA (N6-isopentenyl adenosine(37)-C2)-methylthiotransferase MiaB [Hyphomicrobiales bacterium]
MNTPPDKKVFIKTYGCQMNVYDSQRMNDVLGGLGYGAIDTPDEADLIILNTCHIREKAAEKVYSEIGRLRLLKQARKEDGKQSIIAVAGCVAQAEGEEIIRRAPAVDLVFGPQTYHRLSKLIEDVSAGGKVVETDFPAEDKFDDLEQNNANKMLARGVSAFVTVQEGCDKFCAFCVVPFTRGAEFSRPVEQITREARELVAAGVREITLLGQNVNAYNGSDGRNQSCSLGRLLEHLSDVEGLERLRFTTSHPRDMDDELIAAIADNDKVMPYLHLPVQAGSDKILKAMNRQHDSEHYVKLIGKIRAARPDLALSGDFIVGFPGETDDDFEDTLALVREVTYAQAYSFKYSVRPGTKAADMDEQIPEEVKSERLARLQILLNEQQLAFNTACMGRHFDLLLERPGRQEGQLIGRSPYLQAVHIDANGHKIGEIVPVCVDNVGPHSLSAHII